ncbi:helix-turn-helix transcriptional regulator [Nocardioides sp. S-58]|uniref:Helix-turn-helix transcriptional regulator n=1 Tax=Nocardioides renjunii TaxID=3095075 RepID=A0ABU5KD44_9ACTN|nr:helix-turn-helix transcriptional regulator [Nocardioides sp. S-58]MDZ5662364.1 helix-turn-helix transcriptional regulator [Nocardioides sp. S-58]
MDTTVALLAELRAAREMPSPEVARQIRLAAKLPQARMARALGVNRSTLARWEGGTMQPRVEKRALYAGLLAELQREIAS